MKTISQIGKSALSRIFKPEQKGSIYSGSKHQFERTVLFLQHNGKLQIQCYEPENTETGQITFSEEYKVWSIELGIREVNIENEDNLYKAIYKDYFTKPTHIIAIYKRKYQDFYDNYLAEKEEVVIYRVNMSTTDCFDNSYEEAFCLQQALV